MRTGGRGKHNFLSGSVFRKAKLKIAAAKKETTKARAGKNSFPPTPFLFARPTCPAEASAEAERNFFKNRRRDFLENKF